MESSVTAASHPVGCTMTEELGRLWEARAWYREALRLQSRLSWAQAGYQRVNELLRRQKESKASLPVNPAQTIDF